MQAMKNLGFWAPLGLLFFALIIQPTAYAQPQTTDDEIAAIIASEEGTSDLNERLDIATRSFLGRPYMVNGPLGEGPTGKYDQGPLYRTDGFDCTTFVETTLAMARSHTLDEFKNELIHIRYRDGNIDYTTRNHFVEIDWNPNNIQTGQFEDATASLVSSDDLMVSTTTISKRGWYQAKTLSNLKVPSASSDLLQTLLTQLQAEGMAFSDVLSKLPYIRNGSALSIADQLPVPAVLNVVRNFASPAISGKAPMVAHQVLLISKDGELRVRQATSRSALMKVTDMSYEDFVQSLSDISANRGVNVLKILPR